MEAKKLSKLDELRARLAEKSQAKKAAPVVEAVETKQKATPENVTPVTPVKPKKSVKTFDGTREAWLESAASVLRAELKNKHGLDVPIFRVSVGFGKSAARQSRKLIGQTLVDESGELQVFVSPVAERSVDALLILLTQMLGTIKSGAGLSALALKVGLSSNKDKNFRGGAPFIEDEHWSSVFDTFVADIGSYPHAAVSKETESRESQPKAYCDKSGYKVRLAQTWLDKHGAPFCPCCGRQLQIEVKKK